MALPGCDVYVMTFRYFISPYIRKFKFYITYTPIFIFSYIYFILYIKRHKRHKKTIKADK